MRALPIFLILFLLAGMASAQWYSEAPAMKVQTLDAAESTDVDQVKAAKLNEFNSTTHFVLTTANGNFLAQPDVPRNIIGTMNTSTSGSLKLTGTDINGAVITENLTWSAATGAKSSTNAFKTLTRVDGTCTTNTAQFTLGTGNVLGLRQRFPATTVVLGTSLNGALEGTAPTMTYNSTVVSLNTIDPNSEPGGYVLKTCLLSF